MLIAELIEPGRFRISEGPPPDVAPGQVQVNVQCVGICGSDLLSFLSGGIGGTDNIYPQVLGHEPAGIVARVGSGVSGWSPGDRVGLEPALYCYHCEFCHSGRHNICRNIQFQSSGGIPGFFRQYVSLPAGNLLPLPSGLSLEEATLFEPLAVVLHSMKFVQLQPGETAAVFGAGPIGLLTVVLLKLAGARRVWSVEPVAQRRELARQCGADEVLDPHEVNSAVEILRATGGRGVDVVVDCATRERSLDGAVESVRNGGRLVITGIPHDLETPFNWHAARRKELAIYNVRRSNHESEAALRLLADHVPVFGKLVTHRFALGDIQRAFDLLRDYSDGAGKVIVTAEG